MCLIEVFDHMTPNQPVLVMLSKNDTVIYDSRKDTELAPHTAYLHVENITAKDSTIIVYVF